MIKLLLSRLAVTGRFYCPTTVYSVADLPPLLIGHAPTVSLDNSQSSGGSSAFQGDVMTAKNGRPCKKCQGNEWYKNGKCAQCEREVARQRYLRDRVKECEAARRRRSENPEKSRATVRKYYEKNREFVNECGRVWRRSNPEKARASQRNWKQSNKDRVSQAARDRWLKNPEQKLAWNQARRARKKEVGGSYTAAEWKELLEHYGHRCLCCGRSDVALTVDHIVPITKGGRNDIDNIQPLCQGCNSRKSNKTIDYRPDSGIGRWIQRKLFA